MDTGRIDQNHRASVNICTAVWGAGYAEGGLQCDEYPFKSTYEGSHTSTVGAGDVSAGPCGAPGPAAPVVSESPPEDAAAWTSVTGLHLECPTGELQMGDVTGKAVLATMPTGAGQYTMDVHHKGRDEASSRLLELQHARQGDPVTLDELEPLAAIEQYHLVIRPAPA
ncbi:hypothetical protein ACTMTJ_43615 [Phytohabitans sp. LJ34]|uniref:hypothetical protein n=1 Tax=Phytohabitans sp. LJ34 TaxID=3452217 RepID=UPI003F8C0659